MLDHMQTDRLLRFQDQPWAAFAACRDADPAMFFPGQEESASDAKRICQGCAVNADCLEFAFSVRAQFGIWGGTTPRERRRLRRRIA